MEIDKEIISEMVDDFVYRDPRYSNLVFIDSTIARSGSISGIEIDKIEFVGDEPYDATDLYGKIYVKGSGGWIDIWIKVLFGGKKNFPFYQEVSKKSDFLRIFYNDYLSESRDKKLSKMDLTLFDRVKNRIDEYLGFDSSDIFRDDNRLIRIFGGAVRDSICGDKINDVDILCGSKSIGFLEDLLRYNGYDYMESLAPKDLSSIYTDIHVINEPHTWIKGNKVVQVIRPSGMGHDISSDTYRDGFMNLIANVDISCCGVSYDSRGLYEDFPNAIIHSQSKVFSVNKHAKMYSVKRIHHRIAKFEDRGWAKIENETHINRDLKIGKIFDI